MFFSILFVFEFCCTCYFFCQNVNNYYVVKSSACLVKKSECMCLTTRKFYALQLSKQKVLLLNKRTIKTSVLTIQRF